MKILHKSHCVIKFIAATALMAGIVPAANATNLTLYSVSVDHNPPHATDTDAFSVDYLNPTGTPNPGATYVQASDLYLTQSRTGPIVGTVYVSCSQLIAATDVYCTGTFKFRDGRNSINIQGFYTEKDAIGTRNGSPICVPTVNVVAVAGGTGPLLQGVLGQLAITHTPTPEPGQTLDPNTFCDHHTHNFRYDFSLQQQPGTQSFAFGSP